jgi:hypothetical protein
VIRRAARWVYDTIEAGFDADSDAIHYLTLGTVFAIVVVAIAAILLIAWYVSLIHPLLMLPYFAALGYLALAIIHTNTDQEDQ